VERTVDWVNRSSPYQLTVRLLLVLGIAGFFVACDQAASGFPAFALLPVVPLTVWTVVRPDSHVGLFLVLALALTWFASADAADLAWSLGAGLALLLVHTATAHAALAPESATVGWATTAHWIADLGAVAAVTIGLWVAAMGFADVQAPGRAALTLLAVLATALIAVFLRSAGLPDRDR
jgi:hypothetical protein